RPDRLGLLCSRLGNRGLWRGGRTQDLATAPLACRPAPTITTRAAEWPSLLRLLRELLNGQASYGWQGHGSRPPGPAAEAPPVVYDQRPHLSAPVPQPTPARMVARGLRCHRGRPAGLDAPADAQAR